MSGRQIGKRERAAREHVGDGDAPAPEGFAPGARVLVDGRDEAIVKQHFPVGSSSYLFPHYKVDLVGGDANVAVAISRIGVKPWD